MRPKGAGRVVANSCRGWGVIAYILVYRDVRKIWGGFFDSDYEYGCGIEREREREREAERGRKREREREAGRARERERD